MQQLEQTVDKIDDNLIGDDEEVTEYRVVRTSDLDRGKFVYSNGTKEVVFSIPNSQYSRVGVVKKKVSA